MFRLAYPRGPILTLPLLIASAAAQTPVWLDPTAPFPKQTNAMAFDSVRARAVLLELEPTLTPRQLTWEWDGLRWTRLAPALSPSPRSGHAMAFDNLRARTVLFGGIVPNTSGTVMLGDTWEWDGANWVPRTSATVPQSRGYHGLVYDSIRARTVLFGGNDGTPRSDTWEWDGTNWLLRVATGPSARLGPSMTYDSQRGRTVLFGGASNYFSFGDTWEWDGTNWSLRAPTASPPAQAGAPMAYDSVRGVSVLFAADTWEWNGAQWTRRTPATSPASSGTMVFDGQGSRMLLHTYPDDWAWDGNAWTQLSALVPPWRSDSPLAYDDRRGRAVMFGGYADLRYARQDTWEWDGVRWLQRSPATVPPARADHGLAYDHARGRTVLFGGYDGTPRSDTWEWDGTDWSLRTPAVAPSGRYSPLAYDRLRHRVVLFGGGDSTGMLGDTWEWDGANWTPASPAQSPSARYGHALAFDPRRGRTVLFGGVDITALVQADTWEWDGTNWTQRTPILTPPARYLAALTSDDQRARLVLCGGLAYSVPLRDTWEWDGAAWLQIATPDTPFGCQAPGMTYDRQRGRVFLFGGGTRETWECFVPGQAVALDYGSGCGTPELTAVAAPGSRPVLGLTQHIDISAVPAGIAFMSYGWSSTPIGATPLPLSFAPFGMPGCELLQSSDLAAQPCTSTGPGTARHDLLVPNVAAFAGLRLFLQPWSPAPGANQAGIVVANAIALTLGSL